MPKTTIQEVIARALESRIADVWTAMPGEVVSYDSTARKAYVQPTMRRPIETEEGELVQEDLPIIPAVPVLFTRAGSTLITFPIAAGDTGLLIFLHLPADSWLTSGENANATDLRMHHPSSAVFLPGFSPDTNPTAQGADPALVIEATEIKLGAAATAFAARADLVSTELGKIATAFTGVGGTYTPEPVAASKVKVQ